MIFDSYLISFAVSTIEILTPDTSIPAIQFEGGVLEYVNSEG